MNKLRLYGETCKEAVRENYRKGRTEQTVEYNRRMREKWSNHHRSVHIWDVIDSLGSFVDISDPDVTVPNSYHLFQTAEGIRSAGLPDWMQVVGLLHDAGKIMHLWGEDRDGTTVREQWGIVGDTFIVGCQLPDSLIFPEFNCLNPDMSDERYNTKLGLYSSLKERSGLDSCLVSFGHDEYLYRVLKHNNCPLPEEGLAMVRYHSLYPWHSGGSYRELMGKKDWKMLPQVQLFNKFDLYTKLDDPSMMDLTKLKEYYDPLLRRCLGTMVLQF